MKQKLHEILVRFAIKVTSHLQRPRNRFLFYLKKLNSNIQPNVSIKKKYLESLKAHGLFRKTYFQLKVNISGRCHNLGPGRIPWGSIFTSFPSIAHFTKFTRGSSLFMEKSVLVENSKVEESPWEKKKKNMPK